MTVLNENVPYICIYKITNGPITTICDKQCPSCRNAESLKDKIIINGET